MDNGRLTTDNRQQTTDDGLPRIEARLGQLTTDN